MQLLLMTSPSADPKFVLSILKLFKCIEIDFGTLKSKILLNKVAHLSTLKTF